jgi:hypothetical protein
VIKESREPAVVGSICKPISTDFLCFEPQVAIDLDDNPPFSYGNCARIAEKGGEMLGNRHIAAFIVATLAMSFLAGGTVAFAQNADVPGAPEQLIGNWGKNSDQCRSHHRKVDDVTTITKDAWTECSGTACEFNIASHRKLQDGFQLKYTSNDNPRGWTERIRIVDANKMEVLPKSKGGKKETYTRCNEADAIAGIGLNKNYSESSQEEIVAFAGFYVRTVPTVCAQINVDNDTVAAMTEVRGSLRPEDLKFLQIDAEHAVREDAKQIKNFCVEVFGAFGKNGTVTPDLLKDLRKKN